MPDNDKTPAQLIEELQALRQQLQVSNEKYDSLFEGAGDSIFIVDTETLQILEINTNVVRRLGYSREELLQLKLTDIEVIGNIDSANNLEWVSTFSNTQVYECEYRHKDGSLIPVEVSSRLIQHNQREVFQNFVRNISIRKRAEQQHLELMLEKERMQILANFIQQASHEFRTPLSIINTNTYLLGKTTDPDKQNQQILQIKYQAKKVTTLIEALTLMAKLDSGGQNFTLTEVDLNAILRIIYHGMQSVFEEKHLECVFELSEKPLLLQGDSDYLKQALQHIVENAVRYAHEDSTVTVCSYHKEGNVVIEITDVGDGISKDALPHIFERFYRADHIGATRGFGLGLPIAKAIVELHQGRIEVESEIDQGSTVRILIPVI